MGWWEGLGPNQAALGFVFERSAMPMLVVRADHRVIAANPKFAEVTGYQLEELTGRSTYLFLLPEQRRRIEADWNVLRRVGSVTGDRIIVRSDQQRIKVQFAATRLRVDGYEAALFVSIEWHLCHFLSPGSAIAGAELTPKELEVVSKIAMGMRVHQIAAVLGRSPTTVQSHVRNAMAKLGAHSQAQLVAIAMASGQLDPAALGPEYESHRKRLPPEPARPDGRSLVTQP